MKPFLTLFCLTLILNYSFCQEITSYDEEILGTWEGTISGGGLDAKSLKVVFTYSEYTGEEEGGKVEGFSMVNNSSKTAFTGSYIVDGDMPYPEMYEPNTNPTNGIFKLYLKCTTDEGVQEYCCGEWISYNKKIQREIRLEKIKDSGELEISQSETLDNAYFKTIISKNDDSYAVVGVNILEKNTDKLLQTFDVECEYIGKNQISIGDYNFDELPDFSVFEQSFSGANTSSLYFLFDPIKKQYYNSGFSGVSLMFEAENKRIIEEYEISPEQHMTSIYTVVNNQMVLVEEHCFIWDENKQDYVEKDIKFCK